MLINFNRCAKIAMAVLPCFTPEAVDMFLRLFCKKIKTMESEPYIDIT